MRATRSRRAQTGEKYTEVRRALMASGGNRGGADKDAGVMSMVKVVAE
jgi:hypothetical protein